MSVFKLAFEVRDNEIDIQGVVNNANYFNYFAHARHIYVKSLGFSFSQLAQNKQFVFLLRTDTEFKKSLISEDKFYVTCALVPESKYKFAFKQEIRRLPDETLIAHSHNVCVFIDGNNRNRPYLPDEIKKLLNPN